MVGVWHSEMGNRPELPSKCFRITGNSRPLRRKPYAPHFCGGVSITVRGRRPTPGTVHRVDWSLVIHNQPHVATASMVSTAHWQAPRLDRSGQPIAGEGSRARSPWMVIVLPKLVRAVLFKIHQSTFVTGSREQDRWAWSPFVKSVLVLYDD